MLKMRNMNLQDIFTKIVSICALKKKFDRAIGVYIGTENIFCVYLNLIQTEGSQVEQWKVVDIVGLNLNTSNEKIFSEENVQNLLVEKIAAMCKAKNWPIAAMALCIDSSEIVTDMEDLSNVPKDKIASSVHYQIAVTGNFDVDTYLSSFMKTESGIWMEGILKADAQKWIQAFKDNGMELLVLTAIPNEIERVEGIDLSNIDSEILELGGIKAVFAARSLAYQTNPNFLIERTTELNSWNFAKLSIVMILITALMIAGIGTFDFWKYSQVENELEHERDQLALLESDRRKEEFIEKDLAELKNKNQILARLSEDSFPWRGLLVHFGSIKVDGVWLREMRTLEDNSIEIKGEAVSYEAVASYVKALEDDKDIFSKVELKNSETQSKGQYVNFTINLNL